MDDLYNNVWLTTLHSLAQTKSRAKIRGQHTCPHILLNETGMGPNPVRNTYRYQQNLAKIKVLSNAYSIATCPLVF